MGRVSTCQKNSKTIDLRGAQVNKVTGHWSYRLPVPGQINRSLVSNGCAKCRTSSGKLRKHESMSLDTDLHDFYWQSKP